MKKSALNARLHIFLCLVFRKRELCWLKANVIISAQWQNCAVKITTNLTIAEHWLPFCFSTSTTNYKLVPSNFRTHCYWDGKSICNLMWKIEKLQRVTASGASFEMCKCPQTAALNWNVFLSCSCSQWVLLQLWDLF